MEELNDIQGCAWEIPYRNVSRDHSHSYGGVVGHICGRPVKRYGVCGIHARVVEDFITRTNGRVMTPQDYAYTDVGRRDWLQDCQAQEIVKKLGLGG